VITRGAVIVCDYGAERRRYYASDKSEGTLRCFFRHGVHADPFAFPAVQDLTTDVDFTAVTISATEADFDLQGYTPLSEFMLREQLAKTSDLKKVILSQEMGDRFKVIGFSKGLGIAMIGFSRADWSRLL